MPKILLGVDNIHLGVATQQISCALPGPVITKTRLGWVVCEPWNVSDARPTASKVFHHRVVSDTEKSVLNDLQHMVTDYFSLESFGVVQPTQALELIES